MRYYNKLAIWGNRKRAKLLTDFRSLVVAYFRNVEYSNFDLEVHENREAKRLRIEINFSLDKIHSVVVLAGVNPTMYYSPRPAIGGLAGSIDLLYNMFSLSRFEITPQYLLDNFERAIGIYESDKPSAWVRTINPLFWLGLILDYVVSLPFKCIGKIGFDQERIESSAIGRAIKGILYLIIVLAALLTVLEKIGYLEKKYES